MKYFTEEELTITGTDLPNTPNEEQGNNLHILVEKLLDPIREMWGKPITVNSAFRSEKVNEKVGGVAISQHCKGQAAGTPASGTSWYVGNNAAGSRTWNGLLSNINIWSRILDSDQRKLTYDQGH